MTDTAQLTFNVPKAFVERLEALAESRGQTTSSLAAEALAQYLAVQDEHVDEAIGEALEAAGGDGQWVDHEAVVQWLQSWGTDNELPRPR